MSAPTHAYVSFKPCGCWCGAIVDSEDVERVAAFVAEEIRGKCRVERMTIEATHSGFTDCDEHVNRSGRPS